MKVDPILKNEQCHKRYCYKSVFLDEYAEAHKKKCKDQIGVVFQTHKALSALCSIYRFDVFELGNM